MKKITLAAAMVLGISGAALAADLPIITKAPPPALAPSMWDIAFGGALMTDYNFRGISQSDRKPAVSAYLEPRFNVSPNIQLYVGVAGSSVRLAQDPSAEIDIYGGVRPTFGPLAFDFGAIYYWYPGGALILYPNGNVSLADQSYWEIYGKATFTTLNDKLVLGANAYLFNSWLNTGAEGGYFSGTVKYILPDIGALGWFVSGELGFLNLGTPAFNPVVYPVPADFPDYTTWNIGVAFTYKVFTLDLRYYDTNLSQSNCNILTGDPGAVPGGVVSVLNGGGLQSKWCGSAFVGKLSFDLTLANLK